MFTLIDLAIALDSSELFEDLNGEVEFGSTAPGACKRLPRHKTNQSFFKVKL